MTRTKYGIGVILKSFDFGYKLVFHSNRRWNLLYKCEEIKLLQYNAK